MFHEIAEFVPQRLLRHRSVNVRIPLQFRMKKKLLKKLGLEMTLTPFRTDPDPSIASTHIYIYLPFGSSVVLNVAKHAINGT